MKSSKKLIRSLAASSLVVASGFAPQAFANDQICIVGSSTVYPFSTVVAENFGRTSGYKTPIVESTGTGGGFKLFCSGVGEDTVDINDASRAIKSSEKELCNKNGVNRIIEVKIGYDGIVIANAKNAVQFDLTVRDLYLALAKTVPDANGKLVTNTAKTWKDVNAALPNIEIEVLGPPPTSGTRDAFVELAMDAGCATFPEIKALKKSNPSAFQATCQTVREDGAFIEAGENDNLIVQKLDANPNALGIFGYSFLEENGDKVKASKINGTAVTFEAISDGSYPISRPLFFYVKGEHLSSVPSLKPFVEAFVAESAIGEDGYLVDRGLIPDEQRRTRRHRCGNTGQAPLVIGNRRECFSKALIAHNHGEDTLQKGPSSYC